MSKVVIVIPCYNEANRLNLSCCEELIKQTGHRLLLVNDGSTDETLNIIKRFSESWNQVTVLDLQHNRGKAEAVRAGLNLAIEMGADVTGYLDADFATPPHEAIRLLASVAERPERICVFGARVRLLGIPVRRTLVRHILGRVFATLASYVLRLPVYDTQCGAKFFRVDPRVRAALVDPFQSRWAFDVELLMRLARKGPRGNLDESEFLEIALNEWRDVTGSKMTFKAMSRMGVDLMKIWIRDRWQTS